MHDEQETSRVIPRGDPIILDEEERKAARRAKLTKTRYKNNDPKRSHRKTVLSCILDVNSASGLPVWLRNVV